MKFRQAPVSELPYNDQTPGEVLATTPAVHSMGARPDPRRSGAPVASPSPDVADGPGSGERVTSSRARGYRARSTAQEEPWPETGVGPATVQQYQPGIGTNSYGAPTGAPDNRTVADLAAHYGYDRPANKVSRQRGVGGIADHASSPDAGVLELDTHASTYSMGRVDQRRIVQTEGYVQPGYEPSPESPLNARVAVVTNAEIPYGKPPAFFLGGRPAYRTIAFFMRPFDQFAARHFTGDKVSPRNLPQFGVQGAQRGPRASMPIRTAVGSEAPSQPGSHPTSTEAPGMTAVAVQRNTWRTMPKPWDSFLTNPSPTDGGTA